MAAVAAVAADTRVVVETAAVAAVVTITGINHIRLCNKNGSVKNRAILFIIPVVYNLFSILWCGIFTSVKPSPVIVYPLFA